MSEVPRPGGEIASTQLWQTRVDQATGKEVGVKDIEGKFYPFKNGESFSMDKKTIEGKRVPMVMLSNSAKISFKQWREEIYEPSMREDRTPTENSITGTVVDSIKKELLTLDRNLLNTILKSCSEPGALFGRDVTLNDRSRQEVEKLLKIAEDIIQGAVASTPKYKELQEILDDLDKRGISMFISNRIYEGGDTGDVQLEIREGVPYITAPKNIYTIYRWREIADNARGSLSLSTQKGIAAKTLAVPLRQLATLFKSVEAYVEKK